MWQQNIGSTFFHGVTKHACDGHTDGQTDRITTPRPRHMQGVIAELLRRTSEQLFSSQLPTRIVIGLVDNRAFSGDTAHNPFNFRHFNLSEISLYLDGKQQYALKPIQPNFNAGICVRTYNTLFAGMSMCKLNRDEGVYISRENYAYANGYVLYAFDLTAGLAEDDNFNLARHGSVRLALKFSLALQNRRPTSLSTRSSTTPSRQTEIAVFCRTLACDDRPTKPDAHCDELRISTVFTEPTRCLLVHACQCVTPIRRTNQVVTVYASSQVCDHFIN